MESNSEKKKIPENKINIEIDKEIQHQINAVFELFQKDVTHVHCLIRSDRVLS